MINMFLIDIFSDDLLLVAETLAIVIGSMLMGILLSYLFMGGLKNRIAELSNSLEEEREKEEELKNQLRILTNTKAQLQSEITDGSNKQDAQAKKIFDQQQQLFDQQQQLSDQQQQLVHLDTLSKNQKGTLDDLYSTIDSYLRRLRTIEEELFQAKNISVPLRKVVSISATRANYEHVSKLLGRQVTENDLTLILGIGPKTASLLHANGIRTWEDLAKTSVKALGKILTEAGGVYKSIDPSHWPKQANMAAKSEWRKLRVFQETIK